MSRGLRRGLLLAVAALGCCALAPSGAGAASRESGAVDRRELKVEITGLHRIDWRFRSRTFGNAQAGWTEAHGDQTVGWHLRRKWRMSLDIYPPRMVKMGLPPVALAPLEMPRVKGTASRSMTITKQSPPPACEGGCGAAPPAQTRKAPGCGRRSADVDIDLVLHEGALSAEAEWDGRLDVKYPRCEPMREGTSGYEVPFPSLGYFAGGLEKVKKLRVGQQVKLHKETEVGEHCPLGDEQWAGYQECAVTVMTAEVKRVG